MTRPEHGRVRLTGIVRGFTRFLRLWEHCDRSSPPRQILILIHSIENLGRLRRETSCSLALLPWLKPITSSDDDLRLIPSR